MQVKITSTNSISSSIQRKLEQQISWVASAFFRKEVAAFLQHGYSEQLKQEKDINSISLCYLTGDPSQRVSICFKTSSVAHVFTSSIGIFRVLKALPETQNFQILLPATSKHEADLSGESVLEFELRYLPEFNCFGSAAVSIVKQENPIYGYSEAA